MSSKPNPSNQLRLPEFLGVGPSRTGTTWLHEALAAVVGLPVVKETRFFSTRYERGVEWYAAQFRHRSDGAPTGEICPYFGHPDAPARVQQHIPQCKIICTLRDPVERAYSLYKLRRGYGWTRVGFEEMLEQTSYIQHSSRYTRHLLQWRERFGEERVLVRLYDDLVADRQAFVDNICDFIGARRTPVRNRNFGERAENHFEYAPANPHLARLASKTAAALGTIGAERLVKSFSRTALWRLCFGRGAPLPPLDPEVDARVRARMRPEVDALEKIIQRDLSAWKSTRPA
jgi:Sulfotransferase domain